MSKTLRALYNGEIYPAENIRPRSPAYRAQRKRYYGRYEAFLQRLGDPLAKELEALFDEYVSLLEFEMAQCFVDAFRLGARMAAEVVCEDAEDA